MALGVYLEEDIWRIVCVESSGSCWKDSSLTFSFLSNFNGLTHVAPDSIQTLTGGKGQYTQWVHCELIVGSETICPAHT